MSTPASLTATYTSPLTTQTFSSSLPAQPSSTSSVEEKTAFISAVRIEAIAMQNDINAYLTQKMEEDNAQAAPVAATGGKRSAKDEQREEDMYGEEDVGED